MRTITFTMVEQGPFILLGIPIDNKHAFKQWLEEQLK